MDKISIHALLAESDECTTTITICTALFLSTLSLRRATVNGGAPSSCFGNFYPRSPCGERLVIFRKRDTPSQFLSTLSLRRATVGQKRFRQKLAISIHALLAESDYDTSSLMQCQAKFLSTLSLRRATCNFSQKRHPLTISIHALLAESDRRMPLTRFSPGIFLSTLSLRRATRIL